MGTPQTFKRILASTLLLCGISAAQSRQSGGSESSKKKDPPAVLSFGVLVGGHLRNFLNTSSAQGEADDTSGHLLIGPTLQIHWTRFTLEFDALYRGYGTRSSGNLLGVSFENRAQGRTWEFPVLAKRRFFPGSSVRPILGAGLAMRYLGQSSTLTAADDPTKANRTQDRTYTFGIPLTAGLEFNKGRLRFTPELRYSLWAADSGISPIRSQGLFDSNNNQFQLLVGLTF